MVELEVSSRLIRYCQLRVIQLVPLVCWHPPTTTQSERLIFPGYVLILIEFTLYFLVSTIMHLCVYNHTGAQISFSIILSILHK